MTFSFHLFDDWKMWIQDFMFDVYDKQILTMRVINALHWKFAFCFLNGIEIVIRLVFGRSMRHSIENWNDRRMVMLIQLNRCVTWFELDPNIIHLLHFQVVRISSENNKLKSCFKWDIWVYKITHDIIFRLFFFFLIEEARVLKIVSIEH